MPKRKLPTPTTKAQAQANVETIREWCQAYLEQSELWLNGVKIAGRRSRLVMYDITNNASVANKSMINTDKGEW